MTDTDMVVYPGDMAGQMLNGRQHVRAKLELSNATCTYCDSPPTTSVKTPKGGVVTVCSKHVATAKKRVANTKGLESGGKVTNLSVKDDAPGDRSTIDLSEEDLIRLARIIDLAMTKDGRKSYKRQGKWGHGFIPLDKKARESKAKGSPIALKRIRRLYGAKKNTAGASKPSKPEKFDKIRASQSGATESTSTGRVATQRRPYLTESKASQRLSRAAKNQVEGSKGGGADARAFKAWNDIAEKDKVTRNGKKYVKTIYQGKPQLVRWVGKHPDTETSDAAKRTMTTLSVRDARKLSTAQIRVLLKNPNQSDSVRKMLNRILKEKSAKKKQEIAKF